MKVAVLIVHGIGEQGKDYADKFCQKIDDTLYYELSSTKEVQYFPFEWQHLIEPQEELDAKNLPKLGWQKTCNFAMTYIGDVVAYQRQA
ncbi:hypothetical protein, partial [Enterococcus faecium]|uniref:hypothetical protein n=1 Tax=Enterococcus faecium TaxID=1352 RepID=UPI0034E937BC